MDSAANGAIELHFAHEKALDIERNGKKVRWWGDKLSEMRFYGRIKENWQWMGNEMLHNDWSSVRICNYALTITLKILYEFFVKKHNSIVLRVPLWACYCCIKKILSRYYREQAKSITDNLPVIMQWQLVFYSIWDFVISLCDSRKEMEEKRDWNGKKYGNWYFAVDLRWNENVHLWQHLDQWIY